MNSRDKIYDKLKKFKDVKTLTIETSYAYTGDIVKDFINNASLAGAKVYKNQEDIDNFKMQTFTDSFTYHSSLGVSENGALWCTNLGEDRHKLFSCNDLIISINANSIVTNMHQAYEKINLRDKTFGTFIAGPSKTADIEQSLVIGAHGAMGLHILVLD